MARLSVLFYDLLELRNGDYWIASRTHSIIRFAANTALEPVSVTPASRFKPYRIGEDPASNHVKVLHLDKTGEVWIGTDGGLYRLREQRGSVEIRPVSVSLPGHSDRDIQVSGLAEDAKGNIYAGAALGILRFLPDGRRTFYPMPEVSHSDDLA